MKKRSLNDAELIRHLYYHSRKTVPQIAKAFDVDVKTASYHLEKLVRLGLVEKEEKSYGSKYYLKPELTAIPQSFYIQLALTYSPLTLGIILLLNAYYFASCLLLLISSIFGVIATCQRIVHFKRGRLNEIVKTLKK